MDNQEFQSFKQEKKSLFTGLLAILIIFLASLIISTSVGIVNKIKEGRYIGQEIETRNTISVSAVGEIYAKPDLALTIFSVVKEAETVTEAMLENTKKMNAVINFVKSQGVEAKDLKTTNFNIYPRYEWDRTNLLLYPQGKRVLVGYEVRQSLEVKIRDLGKVGKIIEGATAAGSNQAGNLTFTIDKQDDLKAQARKQAIDKAKIKAKELSSQLGVSLVRITSFSEGTAFPRIYTLDQAEGIGGGEPQIETGENKISVTVTINYEIR